MIRVIEEILEKCLYKDDNKYKLYEDDVEMMFGNHKHYTEIIEKTERIVEKLNEDSKYFDYELEDLLNII